MEDGVGSTLKNFLKSSLGIGRRRKALSSFGEDITQEEFKTILEAGEETGVLRSFEKEMIDGVLRFYNTKAKEIMTPRTKVFSVDIDKPVSEIIDEVIEERYSRIPVYEEDIDNVIGILHLKDLLIVLRRVKEEKIDLRTLLREPFVVSEYKNVYELFVELKKTKNYMAIIVDEYGGFSGIITLEDLMEEIMGDISDEYDEDEKHIEKLSEKTFSISGRMSISEFNDRFEANLPADVYETVGGFILGEVRDIPKPGENKMIRHGNIVFKIVKAGEKTIDKILVSFL